MGHRHPASALAFVATMVASWVLVAPAAGQPSRANGGSAAEPAGAVARTPWGVPDLQGLWDFRTITPLQRPDDLADKAVFTPEEAAEYEAARVASLNKDRRVEDGLSVERDVANAYNHV